ncbi:hypothetical protein ACWDLG_29275 [Nonomuraea sp. NPDC003727]
MTVFAHVARLRAALPGVEPVAGATGRSYDWSPGTRHVAVPE